MLILIAVGFMVAFFVGWLRPEYVVPALFVCAFLARAPRGAPPARGQFLPRGSYGTSRASDGGNPETARRARTFTGSSTDGRKRAEPATRVTPPPPSNVTAHGGFTYGPSLGTETVGYPGRTPPAPAASFDELEL